LNGRLLAIVPLLAIAAGCGAHAVPRRSADSGTRHSVLDPLVRRRIVIARSVLGRPISVVELGDPDEPARALVVGVIHGDERAGAAITRRLERGRAPRDSVLWILDDLNPDGAARRTRQNAHGVDLNRNFPRRWRPLGRRGDPQYSGPAPLSEPESRAAHDLIIALRPRVTIWFHQPLGVTDRSGGDVHIERRFARLSGLPLARLPRYPGSATGWQNATQPTSTAFVVELPPGRPGVRAIKRYESAVLGTTKSAMVSVRSPRVASTGSSHPSTRSTASSSRPRSAIRELGLPLI
jgi:murein peptide amidase A